MQSDGFIASEGNIICVDELDVYAMVGEAGFERLIAAFYRQVPGDPILGPMYPPGDMAGAEQRLRDFLVGRFGGPQRYLQQRGHPRLRMRHHPFAVDAAARERWLQLMGRALDEAQFPPAADALLREFFGAVSEMLINRPG
jgi:hemoglobin